MKRVEESGTFGSKVGSWSYMELKGAVTWAYMGEQLGADLGEEWTTEMSRERKKNIAAGEIELAGKN